MARLEIKIPIRTFDKAGKDAEYIKSKLSGLKLEWIFYGKKSTFVTEVKVIKKKGNSYKHEILGIQKMMEILPDYEKLKDDYKKYTELDRKDYVYDVELRIASEIAVEIDVENNSILFYDGPKAKEIRHRDIALLKRYIKDDRLDEFYADKIMRFVLAIFMSIAITYPEIDINSATSIVSFDGKSYRKERYFSCYPIQNDAAKKYGELMDSKVDFNACFNWIKKYTSLADEKKKTPVVFSALSYVFNREMHEILIYSIIALENIYAPNNKGISYTLQKNMTTVFPCITKDMIKNLYNMRSKFVHGEIPMGNYQLIEEIFDCTRDYDEPSKLAIALLIATIRKLIENDATSIKFRETISFEYCSG